MLRHSEDGKVYMVIITVKMSVTKLSKKDRRKNLFAGDLKLLYVDKYWNLMPDEEQHQQTRHSERLKPRELPQPSEGEDRKKREAFFKAFPSGQIGGVVRVLFEFDVNNEEPTTLMNPIVVNEILDSTPIPQFIIKITNQNMESFFINSKTRAYFDGVHEHLKRKREEGDEKKKKKKE